ncbi:DNA-binding response regulator, LytR/AlgR family [Lachnospiraceae bacterium RM5]|nr:DNA-binding response regulator, LytR/AlgR family [Lachnospiraceae bacterium RM5]
MNILVLDDKEENSCFINNYIIAEKLDVLCKNYITIFSFVTAVCDEYKGDIDVVFICIRGKNDERIEMSKDLQSYYPQLKVVFYSDKDDMAEEIFKARPMFFLKTPFDKKKLDSVFERIIETIDSDNNNSISIKYKGQLYKLNFSNICYVESMARKMIFHTLKEDYESYMTWEEIEGVLPDYFIRCHRSFLVNIYKISKFCNEGLFLDKNQYIPVSRSYYRILKEKLSC